MMAIIPLFLKGHKAVVADILKILKARKYYAGKLDTPKVNPSN